MRDEEQSPKTKGAYGRRLAEALKTPDAASLVSHTTLHNAEMAVTLIKSEVADNKRTEAVDHEDALLIMLQLQDWPKRILWRDDRPVDAVPLKAGAISAFDLRIKWIGHRVCPIHQLNFYLPRRSLDDLCDLEGHSRVTEFDHDPVAGSEDPVIHQLGLALLPAFERHGEANQLFVDHVTTAAAAHMLMRYGVGTLSTGSGPSHLTHQQASRAKEMIAANLDGHMTIAQLACECGLTLSGFNRAFLNSVGVPPHRWLLEQRLQRAMQLLRSGETNLVGVALASGFSGAGHLERVFASHTGLSPLAWARSTLS